MSEYSFRGQPIDGPYALVMLKAIQLVYDQHLTNADLPALQLIVDDFVEKFEEDVRRQQEEIDKMLEEND